MDHGIVATPTMHLVEINFWHNLLGLRFKPPSSRFSY